MSIGLTEHLLSFKIRFLFLRGGMMSSDSTSRISSGGSSSKPLPPVPKKALPPAPKGGAKETASAVREAALPAISKQSPTPAALPSVSPGKELIPKNVALPETPKERGDRALTRKEFAAAVEAYIEAFQQAEAHYDVLKMASSLIDVSGAYAEKGEWTLAAKSLGAALGLFQKKNNAQGKTKVFVKMAELEKRYFEKTIIPAKYSERKAKLETLRSELRQKCKTKGLAFEKSLKEFSGGFLSLLNVMFSDYMSSFGNPSTSFALLHLGLPGPQEIDPYAKLRIAILIKDNTPAVLAYFQTLAKWWSLQLIFLGETKAKTLFPKIVTYVTEGIQFDYGCEFTLEKPVELPLLKTPKQLASFQFARFVQENACTAAILRQPGLLYGDVTLVDEYITAMSPVLSSPSGRESLTMRQQRALHFLNGAIADIEPLDDYEGDKIKIPSLFNLETDLLKFLTEAIAGLSDYCSIEKSNVLEKLDALAEKKIISPEARDNLKRAVVSGMLLRCSVHLKAGAGYDDIYHPRMSRTLSYSELVRSPVIGEEEIEQIIVCLRTFFALQEALQQLCRMQNFAAFAASKLHDISPLARSRALTKLGMFEEAAESLKAKPEPGTVAQVLYCQGKVALALGNFDEAMKVLANALDASKKDDPFAACIHEGLSMGAGALGGKKKSESHLEEARNIYRKVYGEDHPFCARTAYRLAYKKSWVDGLTVLQEAYNGFKKAYGKEHMTVAVSFQSAGTPFCLQAKNYPKAIEYCEGARLIRETRLGSRHLSLLPIFAGLAAGHLAAKDNAKAIPYLQKEMCLRKDLQGNVLAVAKNVFHFATFLMNLAHPNANLFFDEALKLARNVPDKEENHLLKVLELRAVFFIGQENFSRAIDVLEESIRIRRKREKSKEGDLKLADDLYRISVAWAAIHNAENKYRKKAIKALDEAFRIRKEHLGASHESLYEIYHLSGACHCGQGDKKNGQLLLRTGLKIAQRAFGYDSDKAKAIEALLKEIQKGDK